MKLPKDELAARDWWRGLDRSGNIYYLSREHLTQHAFVAGAQYARQVDTSAKVAMAKKEAAK